MGNKHSAGWKRGDPIGYIREEIPEFEVPPSGLCLWELFSLGLDIEVCLRLEG